MKRFYFAAAFVAAMFCASPVMAQNATTKKILAAAENDNQVMKHLETLTSRFGGRLIGSDAYDNAAQWVMHEMKKWGLQDVRLEEAGELSVGFNRDMWQGRLIGGDQPMTLHFATPSYTSGTKGKQRGHVLMEPQTDEELARIKHQLKGAWVLVGGTNGGWPVSTMALSQDSLYTAIKAENRETAKRNRELMMENREKGTKHKMEKLKTKTGLYYKEMVEAGVLGFVQSSAVPIRALYDRHMVNNIKPSFDELNDVVDIKLDESQFAVVERMVKERRDFWLEFDVRNHFKMGPVKYHNVIGAIKGTQKPDEYVIISGHLDAYDVATGAVDCGTGMCVLMESARLLAKSGIKPKRTILFVAFAGEEFGLLGAQAFAKTHEKELPKILNLMNRDGGPLPPTGISVPQEWKKYFDELCKPLSTLREGYPFEVKVAQPRPRPTKLGGTDASVFAMKGVNTYEFRCEDVKGYNFNYGEIWHTENDILNKEIPEYQEHAAVCTAVVAAGLANY